MSHKVKKVIIKRRHINHPWIFSNEIIRAEHAQPGDVVVVEERKKIVGSGFYNPHSLIAVRLFSRIKETFDKECIRQKIKHAYERRKEYGDSYRLIYSESDGLPGLIVDKYTDYLVVQVHSLGMEQHKELVYNVLIEECAPKGIYEKAAENLRKLEGLEIINTTVYGEIPQIIEIEQDGLRFLVDIMRGQKTGFFFDQRENRKLVQQMARGDVLDCFCYTGGFSLYAACRGNVVGIDSSEFAIEYARRNAQLNNMPGCQFMCADVFDTLNQFLHAQKRFDTIILDPPSFTKSKKGKHAALRGYKEINLKAMHLLNNRGLLVTSSCSYYISPDEFLKVLQDAAYDAHTDCIIVHQGRQAKDHPIVLNFPEGNYLKCFFLQRVDA